MVLSLALRTAPDLRRGRHADRGNRLRGAVEEVDPAQVLVAVEHELGSAGREHLSKGVAVPERAALGLAVGMDRVVDQDHAKEPAPAEALEQRPQPFELPRPELAPRSEDRRRDHGAQTDQRDPIGEPERRIIRMARGRERARRCGEPGRELDVDLARKLAAQVGRPAIPAEGRIDRDITVVIARNQEDLLGRTEPFQLGASDVELAGERDVGQVAGDQDAIEGLRLHVAKRGLEDRWTVVVTALERPGGEAREALALESVHASAGERRGVPVRQMGEPEELAHAFDSPAATAFVPADSHAQGTRTTRLDSDRVETIESVRRMPAGTVIASIGVDRKQGRVEKAGRADCVRGSQALNERSGPGQSAAGIRGGSFGSSGVFFRSRSARRRTLAGLLVPLLLAAFGRAEDARAETIRPPDLVAQAAPAAARPAAPTTISPATRPAAALDPKARLLSGDSASENWTLYVELDSGHRITQRFLISNAGPGDHSAVAVGHFMEAGRPPYRYVNGRQRSAWTLSPDHLFFDIGASHLDLHRPQGALRITKDDIDIRLDFDFSDKVLSGRVPASQLPSRYFVEVLAAGVVTQGTIKPPWMTTPLAVQGHLWLVHSWTPDDEAALLDRRVDVFGRAGGTTFYALQVTDGGRFAGAWQLLSRPPARPGPGNLDSRINFAAHWKDGPTLLPGGSTAGYPVPDRFSLAGKLESGDIRLSREWLRFDPLVVIPQPFRWFIRMSSQPQEVWADTRIAVSIRRALENPSLPPSGDALRVSNSQREIEVETTDSNVTGVASITFMNPIDRR